MKRTLAMLLLTLSSMIVEAFDLPLKFYNISSNDGLSQSEVYSILKDSKGYLWIGTVQGLNRYDSYDIIQYNVDNTQKNSLINNTIRALEEDENGRIWIGTDYGLDYFDTYTQQIHHFKVTPTEQPISVGGMMYHDGTLIMVSNLGIFLLETNHQDEKDIKIKKFDHNYRISGNSRSTKLFKSSRDIFYVSYTKGIEAFQIVDNDLVSIPIPELETISTSAPVCETRDSLLLLPTSDVILYNERSGEIRKSNIHIEGKASASATDHNGHIWISTVENGLYELLPTDDPYIYETKHHHHDLNDDQSLSSDMIYSLYVDDNNILWVGTIGSGLDYTELGHDHFGHLQISQEGKNYKNTTRFVRSVYTDDEMDQVLIGLHNNGLMAYDKKDQSYTILGLKENPVFAIEPIGDGRFLIGSSKTHILDRGKIYSIPDSPKGGCFNILRQNEHLFWIASINGLYRLEIKGNKTKMEHVEILPYSTVHNNNCRVLEMDRKNNILWVGTEGGGLHAVRLDNNNYPDRIFSFSNTEEIRKISNSYIRSLTYDLEGNLWVGTYDGLNKISMEAGKTKVELNCFKEKMPSNVIQSLETDNSGNIWAGTNKGLVKIGRDGYVSTFTYQDGIQSNEFSEHANCKTESGILYFGGINGITFFQPEDIRTSYWMPGVTITELLTTDRNSREVHRIKSLESIETQGKIKLKPSENEIDIVFSAMAFASPSKIKYRYMLEGYDTDWNLTDAGNRIATYTNMSYKDYRFKVNATNRDGVWSDKITTLDIKVEKPLLLHNVFIIAYILLTLVIITLISRGIIHRKMKHKAMELEILHNKRLHELDQLRTKFFINISHDLRTPLTLIIGPLEQVIKDQEIQGKTRERINLIYKSATRLKYMVEQLLDFRKIEVGKEKLQLNLVKASEWLHEEVSYFTPTIEEKGLEMRFNISNKDTELYMDCRKVSKIVFNLMSNAIKFTEKGYILVGCFVDEYHKTIKIEVEDSGKGISPKYINKIFERFFSESDLDSYGIGLSYCKDLALSMKGNLTVQSTLNVGTKFTLELPLILEAAQEDISEEPVHPMADTQTETKVDPENTYEVNDSKPTILIVDDNADMRTYMAEILHERYNIITAENGVKGLEMADQKNPDFIISDVMMPEMDGITMTEKLKSDIAISHIPVILLTAKTDPSTQLEGIRNGADDYISKPFDTEILKAKVENILKNRERMRKSFQKGLELQPTHMDIPDGDQEFLKKVMKNIEENIPNSDFTIDTLEKEMFMSHSKFFRKIKSLTGMSGKEILQDMRLKRAVQLLEDTNLPISEIAYNTGFIDAKYFSIAFKQKYDVAPSKYRRK